MKVCYVCLTPKPLSAFYKHPKAADGHQGICKECHKARMNERRADNLEEHRQYDRERGKLPHRIANATRVAKVWRNKDKRRMKCHNAVARAVKAGTLVQQPCERCGAEKSVAHHEDYNKPLDVMWLCQAHHKERHKEAEG